MIPVVGLPLLDQDLAPGETSTATVDYSITQLDINGDPYNN